MSNASALAEPSIDSSLATQFAPLLRSDPQRDAAIIETLKSSPILLKQFEQLSHLGLLNGFVIGPEVFQNRFEAWRSNGLIHFTPGFLDRQLEGALTGRTNLRCILGFMASKLRTAAALQQKEAQQQLALQEQFKRTPSPDITAFLKEARSAHLRDDAEAYLSCWNNEIDGMVSDKGRRLTPQETFHLLQSGRNTTVVLKAAMLPQPSRLQPAGDLTFPIDERNINAVQSVLGATDMPDFI